MGCFPLCSDGVAAYGTATLVGKIEVVRLCRVLGSEGVDLFDDRENAHLLAQFTHQFGRDFWVDEGFETYGTGDLEIRETLHLGTKHQVFAHILDGSFLLQFHIGVADVLQLVEEPLVYLCEVVNLLDRVAHVESLFHHQHPFVGGGFEGGIHIINLQFVIADKAVQTLPNHAETFLDGLFESASNCHHFAHRLHGRTQFTVNTTELAEVPTGYLAHYIVEGWLEEGGGGLGDRVLQVEESVAETEFGCNKGERIARGF